MPHDTPFVDAARLAELHDWLVAGAPPPKKAIELTRAAAEHMVAAGIPLSALVINGFFLHPQVGGIRNSWTDTRGAKVQTFDHAYLASPEFTETPLARLRSDPQEIRYRFDDTDPDTTSRYRAAYHALGHTDLILMPLVNTDGTVTSNTEFATRRPGGFSDDHLAALRHLQPAIARLNECYTERFDKTFTLATYVGPETSRKVFDGSIAPGDGEMISAAILFADLAGFTALSNRLPSRRVLALLNSFFGAIEAAIAPRGGEVLKFLGDGVLAIFPTPPEPAAQRAAARQALAAVQAARASYPPPDTPDAPGFRAALHIGDVFYGNVGSDTRLDFTAIGPAVNLAARMLGAASDNDASTVCSTGFHEFLTTSSGTGISLDLKGWDTPVTVYFDP